jgi:hypothetical protein
LGQRLNQSLVQDPPVPLTIGTHGLHLLPQQMAVPEPVWLALPCAPLPITGGVAKPNQIPREYVFAERGPRPSDPVEHLKDSTPALQVDRRFQSCSQD